MPIPGSVEARGAGRGLELPPQAWKPAPQVWFAETEPAPVLVLAIGNRLLRDDGVGMELLSRLEPFSQEWGTAVELIDGGTCGLALLGAVLGRAAVVFLDAVKLGAEPGSVHVLRKGDLLGMGGGGKGSTAHEGGAKDILAALELLGGTPREVAVVGVEPECFATGIGLSDRVNARLGDAVDRVREVVAGWISDAAGARTSLLHSRGSDA